MNCPICGKEMIKGTVISSGSMTFVINVISRTTEKATNRPPHSILEKNAEEYYCESCNRVFAIYSREVIMPHSSCRPGRFSGGMSYKYFIINANYFCKYHDMCIMHKQLLCT